MLVGVALGSAPAVAVGEILSAALTGAGARVDVAVAVEVAVAVDVVVAVGSEVGSSA